MSNFNYENYGANTFLVYKLSEDEVIDKTCLGMLSSNTIKGIAQVIFTQMNDDRFIKCNITSKLPLSQLFARNVSRSQLLGSFIGICDALIAGDDYMLLPSSFLIDSDYIFADVINCNVLMICLPVIQEEKVIDLKDFFKKMLLEASVDQSENGDYIVRILNYIKSVPQLSISSFRTFLVNLSEKSSNFIEQKNEKDTKSHSGSARSERTESETIPHSGRAHPNASRVSNSGTQPDNKINITAGGIPSTGVHKPAEASFDNKANSGMTSNESENEEHISLLYLLRHYNQENREKYNAQKGKSHSSTERKGQKTNKTSNNTNLPETKTMGANMPFAIPGVQGRGVNAHFDIPIMEERTAASFVPKTAESADLDAGSNHSVNANASRVNDKHTLHNDKHTLQNDKEQHETDTFGSAVSSPNMTADQAQIPFAAEPAVIAQPFWNDDSYNEDTLPVGIEATRQNDLPPYLIRLSTKERIAVDKPEFRIGRGTGYPDYNISDNRAVGHSHAIIVNRGGRYYVIDTNSKNHTYVDGNVIQSGLEAELIHGTKIHFANEAFEFRLY